MTTSANTTYRCESCKAEDFPIDGRTFTSEQAAANHENAYHDGAQTCWPVVERPATVTITPIQANAACIGIAQVVVAADVEDADTWHGGLGFDSCEFCEALVILRAAAGRPERDCYRP